METKENPILAKPLQTTVELIKASWLITRTRMWQLIGLEMFSAIPVIVISVIVGAVVLVSSASGVDSLENASPAVFIVLGIFIFLGIIALVVFLFWGSAAKIIYLKNIQTESSLKSALRQAWGLLRGFVGVTVQQGLITFVGFILFIIPGIYFSIRYMFSQYVYVFEQSDNVRGWKALKRSGELVRGFWWGVLSRVFVFGIFAIAAQMVVNILMDVVNGVVTLSNSQALILTCSIIAGVVTAVVSIVVQVLNNVFIFKLFENLYRVKQDEPRSAHPMSIGKRIGMILIVFLLPILIVIGVALGLYQTSKLNENMAQSNPTEQTMVESLSDGSVDTEAPSGEVSTEPELPVFQE